MTKKQIKRILKRYKYLIYILMGLLGIVCVIYAVYFCKTSKGVYTVFYDIWMGIGCSIIATVAGTIFLTTLLPEDKNAENDLDEWGLEAIYDERNQIHVKHKLPKNSFDIVAFGLRRFRRGVDKKRLVLQIKNGLNIRILIPNPNSPYVEEQQKLEESGELKNEIIDLVKWICTLQEELNRGSQVKGNIEYRIYNSLPLDFYCRKDGMVYIGPYIPGRNSNQTITYKYPTNSKGGRYYTEIFESIWKEETQIQFIDKYDKFFMLYQKNAIESVLTYFAKLFQEETDEPVVGIIAIFKNELRRTFYSCNKKRETNKCHFISKGTIGVLYEENKINDNERVYIFCDYEHKVIFKYVDGDRKKTIIRLAKMPEKLEGNEGTFAILAAPLYINSVLVGALTFDFANQCSRYKKSMEIIDTIKENDEKDIKEIKDIQNVSVKTYYEYLNDVFDTVVDADNIVANMLGQYGDMNYGKLYWEEWENSDRI